MMHASRIKVSSSSADPAALFAGTALAQNLPGATRTASAVALEQETQRILMYLELRRIIGTTRRAFELGLPVMKKHQ